MRNSIYKFGNRERLTADQPERLLKAAQLGLLPQVHAPEVC